MEEYKISVIVPVYKVEKYLNKCVDSIINQTYKNLEIILVDDGSPDNCGKICDEYAKKDSRIKVIHKENGGVSSARNAGLDVVTGDYIGFVDSDDWIEPDMYEFLIKLVDIYNADVAQCGFIRDDGKFSFKNVSTRNDNIILNSNEVIKRLTGNYCHRSLWDKIYKKELFNELYFEDNLAYAEDTYINYKIFKKINRLVYSNNIKYHYFINEKSCVKSIISDKNFDDIIVFKNILESEKNNVDLLKYCKKGVVVSAYELLNRIIKDNVFYDRYYELTDIILKFKKDIIIDSIYTFKYKVATTLILISPNLYKNFILMRNTFRNR